MVHKSKCSYDYCDCYKNQYNNYDGCCDNGYCDLDAYRKQAYTVKKWSSLLAVAVNACVPDKCACVGLKKNDCGCGSYVKDSGCGCGYYSQKSNCGCC